MFALSSIREASPDILADKLGIIGQYLLLRHSGGEPAENVVYGDTKAPDAGFPAAFSRLDGDPVQEFHCHFL